MYDHERPPAQDHPEDCLCFVTGGNGTIEEISRPRQGNWMNPKYHKPTCTSSASRGATKTGAEPVVAVRLKLVIAENMPHAMDKFSSAKCLRQSSRNTTFVRFETERSLCDIVVVSVRLVVVVIVYKKWDMPQCSVGIYHTLFYCIQS